jgi:hypothetical protein
LASNTKKREGKVVSSLRLLFNLIIVVVFIIVFTIVDDGLNDRKTHRRAYFMLALLQVRKPLAHMLVRLTDMGVVGAAHRDEGLEALDKNVLLLAPMSGISRRLRSS